jgi:hypothetical protein
MVRSASKAQWESAYGIIGNDVKAPSTSVQKPSAKIKSGVKGQRGAMSLVDSSLSITGKRIKRKLLPAKKLKVIACSSDHAEGSDGSTSLLPVVECPSAIAGTEEGAEASTKASAAKSFRKRAAAHNQVMAVATHHHQTTASRSEAPQDAATAMDQQQEAVMAVMAVNRIKKMIKEGEPVDLPLLSSNAVTTVHRHRQDHPAGLRKTKRGLSQTHYRGGAVSATMSALNPVHSQRESWVEDPLGPMEAPPAASAGHEQQQQ